MRVHIISYEDLDTWICGKIARRLAESLNLLGHPCTLGKAPDMAADINHHIVFLGYPGYSAGLHTLMVTHIDDALKLRRLREGLTTAKAGICQSSDTLRTLVSLGIDRTKLQYVNLAHDGKAKERRFVMGLSTRLYPDGRKREADIERLLGFISPRDFAFKIMGFGWSPIVERARQMGFVVEYEEEFNYDRYIEMLATLDYYIYLGKDEGSVAFIDALAAGVKTIVTPQGHHLDAANGITHPVNDFQELKQVFIRIAAEKQARIDAVREWTWENYAKKHVAIWDYCIKGASLKDAVVDQSGLAAQQRTARLWVWLWANAFWRRTKMVMNIRKDFDCGSRLWQRRRQRRRLMK